MPTLPRLRRGEEDATRMRIKDTDEEEVAPAMGMDHATAAAPVPLVPVRGNESLERVFAAHEVIKQRGRPARVCEAGVEGLMMGPGGRRRIWRPRNEPIERLGGERGEGRARARARRGERTKAIKRAQGARARRVVLVVFATVLPVSRRLGLSKLL